jgi:putative sterol carrier protein
MSTFTTAAEAEKYLSGVFQAGFATPEINQQLAKSGLVLRMNLSDPDTVITVDLVGQRIYLDDTAPEPNMTLSLSADTANRFWQGKVSLPLAIARGQIKLTGAMPKLLGLLPSAKALNAKYIEALTADGRTDLLV